MKKGDRAKGDRRGISPGFKKSSAVEVGRVRNYGFPRSELWEDFYDVLVAHTREDEEEVPWEELKQDIQAEAKGK
ncbi:MULTISPECIES: hypothetical protein [Limnospira]|uniref:hypothetical protein n=1 Tax=Limnospira TaxID=2596745 RepID=UPI0001D0EFE0|nr:hypothetical protein [Arthrospira platensis NCB002]MDT9185603.1 hypothetical protein [Limnospira sp. PMC 289.06]MDT9297780.1 hypothetical protein [Arthrospira platensis PCC 7345]BAI91744.1 hypothetical protein NIES39_K00950 [Arthrospira platensis NIES-39]